ncbi:GNAT family N-acetyltransferase [Xanthomonas oryzae]|uniref:GNAT family N-acetyltransferase n=1 Tax=Xanthomonas oryzae pv. leersiae TaxID=3112258 RepID=A0AAJ6GUZ2_9XANT|nr:GNAT family N-acetyltransferase [Xanthomonas oryzae]UNE64679.1 GNAT family N-acetyltransferase [Xanthomonas oryzae]WIX08558.1 GNAT family N-acetyltransferase [Xanthomonas oryzae pv. oryzae]
MTGGVAAAPGWLTMTGMTGSPLIVETVRGTQVLPHLDAVAQLRIAVFRAWPYLYEGDAAYERAYLAAYAASSESVFVLARAGETVIGASTGLPLRDDSGAFHAPFRAAGIDPASVFYFGESVLLPAYRGQGIGHAFFDQREAHARALGRFALTAFCSVERAPEDPRKPGDYRPNDAFWRKRGYALQPGLRVHLEWAELQHGEIDHSLSVWTRALPQ